MKDLNVDSKSKNFIELFNEETKEFTEVFKSLDSNSKQFLAGYIVAKNEQHGSKKIENIANFNQ